MAKLVIILAVISLLATCLQVSSAKPVDVSSGDKEIKSGYENKEENEEDVTGLDTGDDEDYSSSGSGSGNEILILTQEEVWRLFEEQLRRLGYDLNLLELQNPQ